MSTPRLTDDEVMDVVCRIESGDVECVCDIGWDLATWGTVSFTTSDGWKLSVFNDGGQWDYVELVEAPDGRCLTTDEIDDSTTPRLSGYVPATIDAACRWGLSREEAEVLVRWS